ncbi:heme A synthase [Euzebya sp.]|uniref:COX15/CtaA family protein n=1 Tax=Euzebya sp. TaxID=1971409 RepID=UPI003511FCC4
MSSPTASSDLASPPAAASVAPTSPAFRRLAIAAAVTSLVVIAVGGATRATDSGLACPTWPGCFTGGDFLPPLSGEFVDGLGRTVTGVNIWLEHSHRLLAGALGLQIAALLIWALVRYRRQPGLLWPTVGAAVAVNIQALLGAFVVWNLVQVELVTAHLGLGTATMALMIYLAVRARGPVRAPADPVRARLWRTSLVVTGVLWLQILIGGHLTGIAGGLAFVSDPAMGLFSIGPITVEADATNVAHRYLALVVAALIMSVAARLRRAGVRGAPLTWARVAAVLVVVQILLGVANLWSNLSFLTVIPHLAVASWMLAAMVLVPLSLSGSDGDGSSSDVDDTSTAETAVPAL